MRYLLVMSILFFLISSCSSASKGESDLFSDQIKGNVSKVTMTFYSIADTDGQANKAHISYKYTFEFNRDGNITHQAGFSYQDSVPKLIEETFFTFNNKGLRIAAQHSKNSKPYMTEVYDSKGQLQAIYALDDKDGTILNTTKLICYTDKSLSEYDVYLPNGKLSNRTVYKSRGDLVTQTKQYDELGKLVEQNNFSYDDNGRLYAKEYIHNGETIKTSIKYSDFDSSGNYLQELSYSQGKLYQVERRKLTYY